MRCRLANAMRLPSQHSSSHYASDCKLSTARAIFPTSFCTAPRRANARRGTSPSRGGDLRSARQSPKRLDIGRAYWGANQEFRYGGDLVDVFHYGNGLTSLAVVDISGHGILAARHAGLVKHALRAYASCSFSAIDSIRALNRLCIENCAYEGEIEFFATAFFCDR